MMNENTPKKPHHHGNLRAALVQAGIDILGSEGLPALTLRKCAARAGVSHAAPAHHFHGVDGLRIAIACEGFDRFRAAMLDAAAKSPAAPRAQLTAIARGYLAFARAEPALYDLIFSFRGQQGLDDALERASAPAYQLLRDTCAPFMPPGTDPVVIETQVWALMHGYVLLVFSGRFHESGAPDDGVLALLDRVGTDPTP